MFAEHVGVHTTSVDVEQPGELVAQPGGIQHRAGADHAFRRQATGLGNELRHDVDRIADHDDNPAGTAQPFADVTRDRRGDGQAVEARCAVDRTPTGRDDDGIAVVRHRLDRSRRHRAGCIEGRAV